MDRMSVIGRRECPEHGPNTHPSWVPAGSVKTCGWEGCGKTLVTVEYVPASRLAGAVEALIDARAALHRACLALGSTDGYNETFARINAAITAAGGR